VRILLDECLPRSLLQELVGHDARTVTQAGWSGLRNSELLHLAAREYDVFLTVDQRLERQGRVAPRLAVITLETPTNRIESLRPLVRDVLEALEGLRPGERIRIGRR